jgi:hypothetical protein
MTWSRVTKFDQRARELADRHYSRQSHGNRQFMPPGRTLVLFRPGAVWGVVEHLDPRGRRVWRCSIFRNETPEKASALVREATALTFAHWADEQLDEDGEPEIRYPAMPLTTEIAPSKVRAKATPGHCFIIAGWRLLRVVPAGHGRPAIHVLAAPWPRPAPGSL